MKDGATAAAAVRWARRGAAVALRNARGGHDVSNVQNPLNHDVGVTRMATVIMVFFASHIRPRARACDFGLFAAARPVYGSSAPRDLRARCAAAESRRNLLRPHRRPRRNPLRRPCRPQSRDMPFDLKPPTTESSACVIDDVVEVIPTTAERSVKIRAEAHVAMTPAPGHASCSGDEADDGVGGRREDDEDRGSRLVACWAVPGSLAEAAGLKAGDVLVEIDGAAAPAMGECGKMLRAHEAGPLCPADRVVPPPSVPPPKPPPKPPPPKPVRVELSVVKTMKSQKLGITLWEDKPGFISVQAVAAGSVVEAAGIRVGDVVVGIGGQAAPSTVHGCILKLKAAEGTCVVAVTRKGAAAAEESRRSRCGASQVAAAAAGREAHTHAESKQCLNSQGPLGLQCGARAGDRRRGRGDLHREGARAMGARGRRRRAPPSSSGGRAATSGAPPRRRSSRNRTHRLYANRRSPPPRFRRSSGGCRSRRAATSTRCSRPPPRRPRTPRWRRRRRRCAPTPSAARRGGRRGGVLARAGRGVAGAGGVAAAGWFVRAAARRAEADAEQAAQGARGDDLQRARARARAEPLGGAR